MNIKYLYIVLFVISINSCREPFDNETFSSKNNILIVNGGISNNSANYSVTLQWAKQYQAKNNIENNAINNAQVYVMGNNGKSQQLVNTLNNGVYTSPPNAMQAEIGQTYYVKIILSNGLVYESIPELMEEPLQLDTIYAELGKNAFTYINSNNQEMQNIYEGLYLYANLTGVKNSTTYCKFDNSIIWQASRKPRFIGDSSVFYRKIISNTDIPNIKATILYNNNQIILKNQLLFLHNYLNDSANATRYINLGWVAVISAKTISKNVYNYYLAIQQQIKSTSQLFDPIPSNIKGNVLCKTDSTQKAGGVFSVYSQCIRRKAYIISSNNVIVTKNVNWYIPLSDTTAYKKYPEAWVRIL